MRHNVFMRKVHLATYKNNIFSEAIKKAEFNVIEYNFPVEEESLNHILSQKNSGYFLIELTEKNFMQELNLARSVIENCKVICVADEINDLMKCLLLENGISDLLMPADSKRTALYLRSLEKRDREIHGRIAVMDDDASAVNIIKTISSRFGFKIITADSIDSLFKKISDEEVEMILINIGMDNIQLPDLIKKSFLKNEMRRSPVIIYKDMKKGMFVHEFMSGLNRISKVILSHDELYSFLLDILFRKQTAVKIGKLNEYADYSSNPVFGKGNLCQVFFQNEKEVFSFENIFEEKGFHEAIRQISSLKKLMLMTEGLRWLRHDTKGKRSICEAGG